MLRDQFLTALSKIDVLPIGAGGEAIGWLDARGPSPGRPAERRRGAGPVCYGKGGTLPTVTDAAAVLGLLAPKAFLGGRRELSVEPAEEAIDREVEAAGRGRDPRSRRDLLHGYREHEQRGAHRHR